MQDMTIAIVQMNAKVGAIAENAAKIIELSKQAIADYQADLILFPELCLTGYPPEDLLLRPEFFNHITEGIETIKAAKLGAQIIIGYAQLEDGKCYNLAGVINQDQPVEEYQKQILPNYQVFDEKRYFTSGQKSQVIKCKGHKIGVVICEDLWYSTPSIATKAKGAEIILSLNASPFSTKQAKKRQQILQARIEDTELPIVYANLVGGQDELVFDGRSRVLDNKANTILEMPSFTEAVGAIKITDAGITAVSQHETTIEDVAQIYQALKLGLKDYVQKNNFPGAIIGLSGGIDSALTLAVAADALGPENVTAVLMPSEYTADMSNEDAVLEAEALQVEHHILAISDCFDSFLKTLAPVFKDAPHDTTEQNIQARCRGTLLMALSNKSGRMVITTGNKSEMAVGYATLYGDMAGGYALLKDVPKTMVYALARYRNTLSPVIPERVITRAPSAELAPDQKDEDSLPPYEILDPIMQAYIEDDTSAADIIAQGFAPDHVDKVIKLINRNEYKRRQAAPGVRITERAFGRDRRYPITSGFFSKR